VLLEREHEIETLDAFVSGVAKPGPRLGLIEGAAGIGKTSLLAEARRIARSDGIRVLGARGSQLEREFSFGVVRQLFEPVLRDPEVREGAFAGAAAPARAVFEDELSAGSDEAGFGILHSLYWVTLNVAGEEPLLLAIDDLHWADHPSLRFVAYLARRLEELPVLAVAAVRPNEPGADAAMIAEIAGDPLTTELHPGPLSGAAVAALIEERLGRAADDSFADACHAATGGNPLLLYELLRALEAEGIAPTERNVDVVSDLGPRAASRAVLLRLARLSDEAAGVARAVAVLGEGTELWAVAELSGLDEQSAAEATGALARAEILRPDPPLGFVHPLVRDAVYLELSPGDRELQHARAAELMHVQQLPAEQISAHLLVAPGVEGEWVAEALEAAARAALSRGASESAVPYLRRALEEPLDPQRRARLLSVLGRAQINTGAADAIENLLAAYEQLDDPSERAEAALIAAWAMIFSRDHVGAKELAAKARAELPERHGDLHHGLRAMEVFSVFFGAGSVAELDSLAEFRRGFAVESGGAAVIAAASAYDWANRLGPADECVALARSALAQPGLFAYDQGMMWCGANLVLVYAEEPDAMSFWDRPFSDIYRGGSLFAALTRDVWGGYTLLLRGEVDEALARWEHAGDEGLLWGQGQRIDNVPAAFVAEALLEKGEIAQARAALASTTSEVTPGSFAGNLWLRAEVEVLIAEGELERAREAGERLGACIGPMDNPAGHPWRSTLARALVLLDRSDEAAVLATSELDLARRWGAPGPIGRALRVLAVADRDRALEHLDQAIEVLEGSQMKLELAKALAAKGSALRRQRKPSDARKPLYGTLELAGALGASALAEHARAELGATGARPRRDALTGVGALTPSERRVAELAASGRSNREIAQELYVTPKTVEVHLSNTYRKLEIRSRRDLPRALATDAVAPAA
jgi:DNA-binding CsgD family transcriptional regulator